MNLDDYDKIPCSAKEYLKTDCTLMIEVGGKTEWFKLVPKRKEFDCGACGFRDGVSGDSCRKCIKPDRFAEVDAVSLEIAKLAAPDFAGTVTLRLRDFARAIVDLIEEKK